MNESYKNPYKVLGLNENSTDKEVRSSYRKMAMKWHPDKNKDNPEATKKFQEITEAYEKITNPTTDISSPSNPMNIFESLFGNIFGLGSMSVMSQKSNNIYVECEVELEMLYKGAVVPVSYKRMSIDPSNLPQECHQCKGEGHIQIVQQIGYIGAFMQTIKTCQNCRGKGKIGNLVEN